MEEKKIDALKCIAGKSNGQKKTLSGRLGLFFFSKYQGFAT